DGVDGLEHAERLVLEPLPGGVGAVPGVVVDAGAVDADARVGLEDGGHRSSSGAWRRRRTPALPEGDRNWPSAPANSRPRPHSAAISFSSSAYTSLWIFWNRWTYSSSPVSQ